LWRILTGTGKYESSVQGTLQGKNGDHMKPAKRDLKGDQMRAEYDFSKGVRGKYAKLFAKGTNIIVLDPDVAKVFKNSKEVNSILRTLTKIAAQKAK